MPLRIELPYRADSAALFEAVADSPWSVWLDSGGHHLGQSRFDIIAAEPHTTLVTRGNLTEIRSDAIELSRDDPLALLREHLDVDRAPAFFVDEEGTGRPLPAGPARPLAPPVPPGRRPSRIWRGLALRI